MLVPVDYADAVETSTENPDGQRKAPRTLSDGLAWWNFAGRQYKKLSRYLLNFSNKSSTFGFSQRCCAPEGNLAQHAKCGNKNDEQTNKSLMYLSTGKGLLYELIFTFNQLQKWLENATSETTWDLTRS